MITLSLALLSRVFQDIADAREARLARRLLGREASGSACPPAGRISALATPALLCPLSPSEFLLEFAPSVRRACQARSLAAMGAALAAVTTGPPESSPPALTEWLSNRPAELRGRWRTSCCSPGVMSPAGRRGWKAYCWGSGLGASPAPVRKCEICRTPFPGGGPTSRGAFEPLRARPPPPAAAADCLRAGPALRALSRCTANGGPAPAPSPSTPTPSPPARPPLLPRLRRQGCPGSAHLHSRGGLLPACLLGARPRGSPPLPLPGATGDGDVGGATHKAHDRILERLANRGLVLLHVAKLPPHLHGKARE